MSRFYDISKLVRDDFYKRTPNKSAVTNEDELVEELTELYRNFLSSKESEKHIYYSRVRFAESKLNPEQVRRARLPFKHPNIKEAPDEIRHAVLISELVS